MHLLSILSSSAACAGKLALDQREAAGYSEGVNALSRYEEMGAVVRAAGSSLGPACGKQEVLSERVQIKQPKCSLYIPSYIDRPCTLGGSTHL
jgi:hypothetical protein